MGTLLGITLVKRFTYRDDPLEEWSNTYHFDGAIPADDGAWKDAFDALAAEESLCFGPTSKIIRAYGYDSDDDHAHAVADYDYENGSGVIPGQIVTPSGSARFAGDQAGIVWAKTNRKNSRGKWVYLRKYLHDGFTTTADVDKVHPNQLGYYVTFANHLALGTIGDLGIWRSRTHNDGILDFAGSEWVTTRTLHRRGKRPLAPA